VADAQLAADQFLEIPVQVNGKLRTVIKLPVAATKDELLAAAMQDDKVATAVVGKEVVRQVVVPGKLVNVVVK
jgi:leucyl-tRNA synthetase